MRLEEGKLKSQLKGLSGMHTTITALQQHQYVPESTLLILYGVYIGYGGKKQVDVGEFEMHPIVKGSEALTNNDRGNLFEAGKFFGYVQRGNSLSEEAFNKYMNCGMLDGLIKFSGVFKTYCDGNKVFCDFTVSNYGGKTSCTHYSDSELLGFTDGQLLAKDCIEYKDWILLPLKLSDLMQSVDVHFVWKALDEFKLMSRLAKH